MGTKRSEDPSEFHEGARDQLPDDDRDGIQKPYDPDDDFFVKNKKAKAKRKTARRKSAVPSTLRG
jgi:hypothetical protein